MGFRFRKSFRVLPGVRLNLSKTGVGASFGFKGFRITKRADGKTQKTFTLPGTGISYVDVEGNGKKSGKRQTKTRGKCPSCGASYSVGVAQFCQKCGHKLA